METIIDLFDEPHSPWASHAIIIFIFSSLLPFTPRLWFPSTRHFQKLPHYYVIAAFIGSVSTQVIIRKVIDYFISRDMLDELFEKKIKELEALLEAMPDIGTDENALVEILTAAEQYVPCQPAFFNEAPQNSPTNSKGCCTIM